MIAGLRFAEKNTGGLRFAEKTGGLRFAEKAGGLRFADPPYILVIGRAASAPTRGLARLAAALRHDDFDLNRWRQGAGRVDHRTAVSSGA
jgi:hypothetical protein